ncbi:hypothetical protein GGR50DRAFT_696541 [Xylaria sp. CBS 124048]|nr:hypothetical protein GGR50DRAFT_696541 [Xylaria sp. CBS 124048]
MEEGGTLLAVAYIPSNNGARGLRAFSAPIHSWIPEDLEQTSAKETRAQRVLGPSRWTRATPSLITCPPTCVYHTLLRLLFGGIAEAPDWIWSIQRFEFTPDEPIRTKTRPQIMEAMRVPDHALCKFDPEKKKYFTVENARTALRVKAAGDPLNSGLLARECDNMDSDMQRVDFSWGLDEGGTTITTVSHCLRQGTLAGSATLPPSQDHGNTMHNHKTAHRPSAPDMCRPGKTNAG